MYATATKVKALWTKMCEFDGVNPNTKAKFVVFSQENPYINEYNEAVMAYYREVALMRSIEV